MVDRRILAENDGEAYQDIHPHEPTRCTVYGPSFERPAIDDPSKTIPYVSVICRRCGRCLHRPEAPVILCNGLTMFNAPDGQYFPPYKPWRRHKRTDAA
jgi:hypothetical protein